MSKLRHGFRTVLRTRRGRRTIARDSLATFGVIGGSLQVYDILTPGATYHPVAMVGLLAVAPLGVGLFRSWPRRVLSRGLDRPDVTVSVKVGDLFEQDTHLVIGFTDTFDTDARIIHPSSVQAQFQRRLFPDTAALDEAIAEALANTPSEPANKPKGKTQRYPIGTTAVLESNRRLCFCLAYAVMGEDMLARSTVDDIWTSLSTLWDAVYLHAHREPVSIAIVGSDLAKIDTLDRASLIRLIALSFIARSRTSVVSRELTIMVHPADVEKVDLVELGAFLSTI
ncbi:macro domain-containing protein [Actinokineospora sp. HUAS TT18]|uniref:macro domain-containing protein n=1 Tax=Actinokineospora sp. HUAS TT18 TaxID=3447451 RepID=UPI003F521D4D